MQDDGARFLIRIGARRLADGSDLPSVPGDLERIAALFTRLGYREVLPEMRDDPPAAVILDRLSTWLGDPSRSATDLVVIYYSGHGVTQAGRHYLLSGGTDPRRLAGTALSTSRLVELLADESVRLCRLLILLDACHAGQGAFDIAGVADELTRARPLGEGPELWVLAAARSRDEAEQSLFSEALVRAVDRSKAGPRQPCLTLMEVADAVNAEWRTLGAAQHAFWTGSGSSLTPFLPNRHYVPDLPRGIDVETQRHLIAHWGPRSRGVEIEAQPGWHFTGRTEVLRGLVHWLTSPPAGHALRVITGGPGSGKSAVLARLVTLSDPTYRSSASLEEAAEGSVPPVGLVDAAIHARGKTLEQITAELAEAANLAAGAPALVVHSLAQRDGRFVLVLDALDEAAEPQRIAADLLLALATAAAAGADLRILVGTRRELLPPLRSEAEIIDLDQEAAGLQDLAAYVERLLLAGDQTPYRDKPELARRVGQAVAERAFPAFLIGRLVARNLVASGTPVDPGDREALRRLPASVGEAFEEYLRRFAADAERVRDLLEPLASAEGIGLPWDSLWAPLASVLSGRSYGDADVRWLLANAASYLVEDLDEGRSVYRLYHQALAEHLRNPARTEEAHRRFARTLIAQTPERTAGGRDWLRAHPYVRSHLATHAARAGELETLLIDPLFVLAAERSRLLRVLGTAAGEEAREVAEIYRRAADRFQPGRPLGEAASYFEMAARQVDAVALADRIASLPLQRSWRAVWAHWEPSAPYIILGRHEGKIQALAFAEDGGEPVVVSGGLDGIAIWRPAASSSVRVPTTQWVTSVATGSLEGRSVAFAGLDDGGVVVVDLADGSLVRTIPTGGTTVRALAVGHLDGAMVLAIGTSDYSGSVQGEIRFWNPVRNLPLREPLKAFLGSVQALAFGCIDGRSILVAGGDNVGTAPGLIKVWTLPDFALICAPDTGAAGLVRTLALAERQGRTVIVSGDTYDCIHIWDGQSGQCLDVIHGERHFGAWVESVALTELNGMEVVAATMGPAIRFWKLADGTELGSPLEGHAGAILALAVGRLEGRPVIFSGGADRTLRVWSPADALRPQPHVAGHRKAVRAVANSRYAGEPAVVSAGDDATMRLWRLADGAPLQEPLTAHKPPSYALATGWLGDRPVAVSGGSDCTLRRWFLDDGSPAGEPLTGHQKWISALALAEIEGRLILASGDDQFGLFLWDFASGERIRSFKSSFFGDKSVEALVLAEHGGRPVLIVGGGDRRVSVWDIATGRTVRKWGLTDYVRSLVAGRINGRSVIASGGDDGCVYLFDPDSVEPVRKIPGHGRGSLDFSQESWIQAVALGEARGRPVILSGGKDRILRVRSFDGVELARIDLDTEINSIVRGAGSLYVLGTEHGLVALQLDFQEAGALSRSAGEGRGGGMVRSGHGD